MIAASMVDPGLVVAIPTYRRASLLSDLLGDLLQQSVQPESLVVVDGDPSSGEVRTMLEMHDISKKVPTWLIPSNHANLPYQRYLGWLSGVRLGAEVVGFLDDDLRITKGSILQKLLQPFDRPSSGGHAAAGVTAEIQVGGGAGDADKPVKIVSYERYAGDITAGGHRYPLPAKSEGEWTPVRWFRGRVIFLRMDALDASIFSHDLFAMYEKRVGKGEDSVLGLRVSSHGEIAYFHTRGIVHPGFTAPVAYPASGFARGRAIAYSRRLINDNLRYPERPTLRDRVGLLKSYAGTTMLLLMNALVSPSREKFAEAAGFASGSAAGLMVPPWAERLTPGLKWEEEAERAMGAMMRVPS